MAGAYTSTSMPAAAIFGAALAACSWLEIIPKSMTSKWLRERRDFRQ